MLRALLLLCLACTRPPADPAPNLTWKTRSPLPGGPVQEAGVAELNGKVYVVGGLDAAGNAVADVHAYDPVTDTWETIASLSEPRHHPNVASVNGKLYVIGALGNATFVGTGGVDAYDPATNSWSRVSLLPPGTERGASAVGVIGTRIYVAGGISNQSVAHASAYDTANNTWEILPALSEPRDHLAGGVLDGVFYAAAGRKDGAVRGTLEAFKPGDNAWSLKAPVPTPRGGCAGAAFRGRLYVIGGEGNRAEPTGVFSQTESYDPTSDSWTPEPSMLTPRHGIGAAVVGDSLYAPGGGTLEGLGAVDTHEALTPDA